MPQPYSPAYYLRRSVGSVRLPRDLTGTEVGPTTRACGLSICDRLALTLVNQGQLSDGDFEVREGGAVLLGDKGRRKVVAAWQERKQEEITHPLLEQMVPIGLLPFVQARLMTRAIRGETTGYLPYLSR